MEQRGSTPKAVLFDLDDTLIAFDGVSKKTWEICCRELATNEKLSVSPDRILQELDRVKAWYWADPIRHKQGRENLRQARREVAELAFSSLDLSTSLAHVLADSYTEAHNRAIRLFPDTLPVLNRLKYHDIRLGLITNGSSMGQRTKLERFGLLPYFECVLIDQEVGFSKPDPRIFRLALSELQVLPQESYMVGDNLVWEIEPAKSLGLRTAWCDFYHRGLPDPPPVQPDHILSSLSDLLPKLKE